MGYCNKKFSTLNKNQKSLATKQKIKKIIKGGTYYEYSKKHRKPGSETQ